VPVVRLAFMVHALTFEPWKLGSVFDVLTLGRYHPNAATSPSDANSAHPRIAHP